jgi:hypothetical protein
MGTIRSSTIFAATMSPPLAFSITACTMASHSSPMSFSATMVVRCRAPLGFPGFP